ncbi:heavy metal translocating P-type ATPase [Pollutimonas thiosulfatoxidans]|uniref:Copper-translocating P-type ATPase n=1 Tax=Pollutimonas thiosulfatoxidans TaxID=2028345 RepID=A0A410GA49_9BURK|nr:heavy metal translocating P-type ATPase [Pollutimonas thiosulfatoxidans]QAA93190.1 copper-translocating P-type ATPase [Pollutimonas thiosulfatoxidans]
MPVHKTAARTRTWPIGGMVSAGCARTLEKVIAAVPGVTAVSANYANASLQVSFDPTSLSTGAVAAAIRKCGFDCEAVGQDAEPTPEVGRKQPHSAHAEAHDAHAGMHHGNDLHAAARDMRRRFLVALAFAIPVFLWSPMGMTEPPPVPFGLRENVWLFLLATGAVLYPGWPFFAAAVRSLRRGVLDMAVLVLLSVGTGYGFSIASTFLFDGPNFFEASAVLLTFVLLGHWLEMRARAGASDAMKALLKLSPPRAVVRRSGQEIEMATAEVLIGDLVVVRPGAKVPVDGVVTEGSSQVDESMLTGESMPVRKDPGALVVAGSINKSGAFTYSATKIGSDTALAQIIKLVQDAQNSKAPAQLLADRASQWLVLAAIVIGLGTFAVWFWWLGQPLLFALTLTITVFVIACPDALGLATPMAIMIGTGLGARHGILFKHAESIEKSARLDVVIFDKTGTLTVGAPEVVEMAIAADWTQERLLAVAAAVEAHSEHPLAQAILKRAGPISERAVAFTNIDGQGAMGMVDEVQVLLGNRLLMVEHGIDLRVLEVDAQRLTGAGRTVIFTAVGGQLVGLIAIADAIRETSRAAIDELHRRSIKVAMITGDNRPTAERVARDLGIDIVLADVLPGGKADEVKKLQAQGLKVGMVGDGINDAPALTQADVGFAIGAGTDVAIDSADIVLMRSDPHDVVRAITVARATLRKMHQNLAWAVGYNVFAFPLAAGVLYPFTLSPEVAALSMSGSSVIVALNALLLRRVRLAPRSAAATSSSSSLNAAGSPLAPDRSTHE